MGEGGADHAEKSVRGLPQKAPLGFEPEGRGFESLPARHFFLTRFDGLRGHGDFGECSDGLLVQPIYSP